MDSTSTTDMQRASQLLKLLGDQTRLTMMKLLQSHDYCVCEFTAMFNMSQPAISQHLRKLREIELVRETRKGKWIFYSINQDHVDYPFVQHVLEQLPGQDGLKTTLEAQGLRICCE